MSPSIEPEVFMVCPRCGAVMYYEEIYTIHEEPYWTWRCILCGEYVDEIVMANRARQASFREDHLPEAGHLSEPFPDTSRESSISCEPVSPSEYPGSPIQ